MPTLTELTGEPLDALLTLDPDVIFDAIMQEIEPELVSSQKDVITEKYKDETPEEKQARGDRYAKAFEEYDKRYAQFELELQSKVHAYKSSAMKSVEQDSRQNEVQDLAALESSLAA